MYHCYMDSRASVHNCNYSSEFEKLETSEGPNYVVMFFNAQSLFRSNLTVSVVLEGAFNSPVTSCHDPFSSNTNSIMCDHKKHVLASRRVRLYLEVSNVSWREPYISMDTAV